MQRVWSGSLARSLAMGARRGYAFKVDIKALKQLREQTGAGLSKAKEALQHTNNDLAQAAQWLSQDAVASGAKRAAKVAGRVAGDGAVSVHTSADGTSATMAELLCETDFVARNAGFVDLAWAIARVARGSVEQTREQTVGDKPVDHLVTEAIGRLGENMVLRRVAHVGGPGCVAGAYVHMPVAGSQDGSRAGRIGALVALRCAASAEEHRGMLGLLARRLAQQVAGYAPRFATRAECGQEECPDEMVLEAQQFLFGGGSVAEVLEQTARCVGAEVKVDAFVRFERAEGVEKPQAPDFAQEVRQAAGLDK
ncbi:hypothetical protein GGI15_000161 [Coemansia interrupta]|uniref:Elongation factor Ts, mitochondrial n=1 Tax=Coemansia interrupta TaxID=1126814 RepID=A0A9W8HLR0_9FUNG|nr:hypothetical protein GGI15_000161 [Coemansia interrupta]